MYEYVNGVWPTFMFSKSVSVSLSGSKSTVAPTQWLAATSVMMAAIPIPIPIAIPMVAQWNPETHDLRTPLSLTDYRAAPERSSSLFRRVIHFKAKGEGEVV